MLGIVQQVWRVSEGVQLQDTIVLTDCSVGKGNGNEKESEIEKDY